MVACFILTITEGQEALQERFALLDVVLGEQALHVKPSG